MQAKSPRAITCLTYGTVELARLGPPTRGDFGCRMDASSLGLLTTSRSRMAVDTKVLDHATLVSALPQLCHVHLARERDGTMDALAVWPSHQVARR